MQRNSRKKNATLFRYKKKRAKERRSHDLAPVSTTRPHYIVGVGASAGGLEALQILCSSLKEANKICLVIVQHLAPQHRSRLVEILSHSTKLEVREVSDGTEPVANTVYITPPNADVVFRDGLLRLEEPEAKIGPKPSIDRFFETLAEELGEKAIGVILSGTGSDGSKGITAIKQHGGTVLCQAVGSAKYDGMPRAARQTGFVDHELPPDEIAKQLSLYNSHISKPEIISEQLREGIRDPYDTIFSLLEMATRVDFKEYKQPTVKRRIARRMAATGRNTVTDYARYLANKPEEVRLLYQDILISVTSFFRDEPAFEALKKYLVERVKEKSAGQKFRCWVVGCATGEEVYSILISLLEIIEAERKRVDVQFFATDIDEQAMTAARRGVYSKQSLSYLSPKLVEKYFDQQADGYKVKEFLRELIVFARHDVTQDPPFLKLDLITCRNVLIYFGTKLQERVFKTFYFGLDDGGILFLGKSETTGASVNPFLMVNKEAKIYVRRQKKGLFPSHLSSKETQREKNLQKQDRELKEPQEDVFTSLVLGFAPDSVLIDDEGHILHIYGNANQYLNLPKGNLTIALSKLLDREPAIELSSLVRRARQGSSLVKGFQTHLVRSRRGNARIQLSVIKVELEGRTTFLVVFHPLSKEASEQIRIYNSKTSLPLPKKVAVLERALKSNQKRLQSVVEEHETANEELQALNEELQSSNEELQSTNEELETTNEELQSTNEELTTLNQEMNVKSAEYLALNQRYLAVQNAIFYPLLMVDVHLRLVDFNPAARYLFRISEGDCGHHLKTLSPQFDMAKIIAALEACVKSHKDQKLQLRINDRDFEIRVQSFNGIKGTLDGMVLSFVENTEIVRAFDQVSLHRNRLSSIMENTPALVTMKDTMGMYTYANNQFYDLLKLTPETLLGKTDEEVFGTGIGDALRLDDFDVLKNRRSIVSEQKVVLDGKTHYWLSSKFPLLDEQRKAHAVCSVSLDISEKRLHQQQLQVFREVVSASSNGIAVFEEQEETLRTMLVSNEFASKVDLSPEKLLGQTLETVFEAFAKNDLNIHSKEILKAIASRNNYAGVVNLEEKAGRENWVEIRLTYLREPERQYVVLMFFDANQRTINQKLIEQQRDELAKFGRLAALGEVAAGLSHEINTPLNVITTKTDLLRLLAKKGSLDATRVAECANEVDSMVKSISSVISGLKSMAKRESKDMVVEDLLSLASESLRICEFRLRSPAVQLKTLFPEGKIQAYCYPVQVIQILVNLINNAIEAISEFRERWIEVKVQCAGKRCQIIVTDSGNGIDPAIAERIMTPFFTTKKEKNGTGLGLSLSRSMARRMGGDLYLKKDVHNTCFILELPHAEA